jgi:hypothetical protein
MWYYKLVVQFSVIASCFIVGCSSDPIYDEMLNISRGSMITGLESDFVGIHVVVLEIAIKGGGMPRTHDDLIRCCQLIGRNALYKHFIGWDYVNERMGTPDWLFSISGDPLNHVIEARWNGDKKYFNPQAMITCRANNVDGNTYRNYTATGFARKHSALVKSAFSSIAIE